MSDVQWVFAMGFENDYGTFSRSEMREADAVWHQTRDMSGMAPPEGFRWLDEAVEWGDVDESRRAAFRLCPSHSELTGLFDPDECLFIGRFKLGGSLWNFPDAHRVLARSGGRGRPLV